MPETKAEDVLAGHVLEWHSEEGWGVLVSDSLPDQVWAHFSAIQASGFRELTAGQLVTFSAEEAEQDEYHWRAVRVWPEADVRRPPNGDDGPGYSSGLDISFDS
ncbi:cold-shock protein [Streptomyces muensis]|uniref:Cold shock domain-containing protein n=1 Tax=Streptomyces muensis TaxID=1077944 RepID=A0A9X1PZ86_STRM4|nr:cold shock domain-containing protein [Streptomyces muensis]MCF1594366.1 cold shock domain-containing protein [Streptomyces muensis]